MTGAPADSTSAQEQLSAHILDCVHELRRVSDAKAGLSNWQMLSHVQLLVERFPQADPSTQHSLLRLLGSALAQQRSRQLWLTLGKHTGAQRAIRCALAPHVAAWHAARCQRLWTLLARAHFRLLWQDPQFFEDTLTAEFIESMSPYTVCVAVAAAVRMRPHLQPGAWGALMGRVAATAAAMDDTSARETFRMFAHLAPPWRDAPQHGGLAGQGARGRAETGIRDTKAFGVVGPGTQRAGGGVHTGHPEQSVRSVHSTDVAMAHSGHRSSCGDDWGGSQAAGEHGGTGEPLERRVMSCSVMDGDFAVPVSMSEMSQASATSDLFQESFDAFLGGSADLSEATPGHVPHGPTHQHTACGSAPSVQHGTGGGRSAAARRHARVWVADQLPEPAWRAARVALERRLQLSVRDAAALRRQLRRASASDLQLNAWQRERLAAQARGSHRGRPAR